MQTFLINFLIVLSGWISGALINYLSEALPYRRRLVRPFCIECSEPLPPVAYLTWPRRCSNCGKSRHWSTWLVEALTVGAALWMWHSPPPGLGFAGGMLLLVYFGVVVVIDLRYRLILHPVSIAGAIIGLVIGARLHGITGTLIGGAAGFGMMYVFYYLGVLFARFMARRRGQIEEGDALGYGDVNLTGVLGLMLGWPAILPGLILAVLVGGAFSLLYLAVMLLFRRYKLLTAIPYGPFLILGAVLILFFPELIISIFSP